uniref:Raftlin n=1 Tax=Globodera pallida TaxID=36090 RepID=A0A183BP61_GLOPA
MNSIISLFSVDASPAVDKTPGTKTPEDSKQKELIRRFYKIKISGLIAEYTGKNTGFRSVFAEESIPNQESGIFYFEVKYQVMFKLDLPQKKWD